QGGGAWRAGAAIPSEGALGFAFSGTRTPEENHEHPQEPPNQGKPRTLPECPHSLRAHPAAPEVGPLEGGRGHRLRPSQGPRPQGEEAREREEEEGGRGRCRRRARRRCCCSWSRQGRGTREGRRRGEARGRGRREEVTSRSAVRKPG